MESDPSSSHGHIAIEPKRLFEFFAVVTRLKAKCFTVVTYPHMVSSDLRSTHQPPLPSLAASTTLCSFFRSPHSSFHFSGPP